TLPFAPSLAIRAFLLPREEGNLVVYSSDGLASAFGDFVVERHYLNHSHEAMFASDPIGAPVYVHEAERPEVAKSLDVRATFSRRHQLEDDFEAIPTPGHTPGTTAYLWDDGDTRYLFTGDTPISTTASGWPPCSGQAIARPTSRASS
ncbi:MAG: hypothetical protein ACRDSN_21755, partial [Pseudonocardiaceae bacterium]